MPASQVLNEFRAGRLHSGSHHGPIVTSEAQAKAIQINMAREEGHVIPKRKSARSRIAHARAKIDMKAMSHSRRRAGSKASRSVAAARSARGGY